MNKKEIIIIEEDNKERFLEEINNWNAKVGIEIKDIKYSNKFDTIKFQYKLFR